MREIEVKILNISIADIIKKLHSINTKKLTPVFIVDKKFDFPDGRLKRQGDVLRLRQADKTAEITFKTKKRQSKFFRSALEFETAIDDVKMMEKILLAAGMVCIKIQEKKRSSFLGEGVRFEIDEYPGIPPFLEIEGSPKTIRAALQSLNLSLRDTTTMTAPEVIRSYGFDDRFISFKKKPQKLNPHHVYIARCADGTLYTGSTSDIKKRLAEHNQSKRGAKYTRARRPVKIVYTEKAPSLSAARRREAAIKRLPRSQKLRLIKQTNS